MSTLGTMILLPIIGHVGDKLPSKLLIPVASIMRGICGYSFLWLNDPHSIIAMAMCILLVLLTMVEGVSIEVLLMRDMPG